MPQRRGGGGSSELKLCYFSGPWGINQKRDIILAGQTNTSNTVQAWNHFVSLSPPGTCLAVVGKATLGTPAGGEQEDWYLLQVDLTRQPGYASTSSGTTVILSATGGVLGWLPVAGC
jgi:hypothetical protein